MYGRNMGQIQNIFKETSKIFRINVLGAFNTKMVISILSKIKR